jgi:hypothetical protein
MHAQAALRETISTMSARIIDEASVTIPIIGSGLNEEGIVRHPEIKAVLLAALQSLATAVSCEQRVTPPMTPSSSI